MSLRVGIVMCLAMVLGALIVGCGGSGEERKSTLRVVTVRGLAPINADWVAFQDGDGGWQTLAPTATGNYNARVTNAEGRYGLTLVDDRGNVQIIQATLAELSSFTLNLPPAFLTPFTATISGLAASTPGAICIGPYLSALNGAGSYAMHVPVAGRYDGAVVLFDASHCATQMDLQRRLLIVAGGTVAFDWATDAQVDLTPAQFALDVASDSATVNYLTNSGATVAMGSSNGDTTCRYGLFPSALRESGEAYATMVSSNTARIQTTRYTLAPPAGTLFCPGPLSVQAGVTVSSSTPYSRPMFTCDTWPADTGFIYAYFVDSQHNWTANLTPGWARHRPIAYTIPDFSALTGWSNSWGLGASQSLVLIQRLNRPLQQWMWAASESPAALNGMTETLDVVYSGGTQSSNEMSPNRQLPEPL